MDDDEQNRARTRMNFVGLAGGGDAAMASSILVQLERMIRGSNPFYRLFLNAVDSAREAERNGEPYGYDVDVVPLGEPYQPRRRGEHRGQYGPNQANDVGGVRRANGGAGRPPEAPRQFIVRLRPHPERPGSLQYFPTTNGTYDPLMYVLLFPFGQPGWNPNIGYVGPAANAVRRANVTALEFYRYRLQIRNGGYQRAVLRRSVVSTVPDRSIYQSRRPKAAVGSPEPSSASCRSLPKRAGSDQ